MNIDVVETKMPNPGMSVSSKNRLSDPFLSDVIAVVADEFGLSEREMMVHSRGHRLWKPRMAAMYFARVMTGCSLPELGRCFGGRNHTTVLRAYRRCREMMEQNADWSNQMDRLLVRLTERMVCAQN